MFIRSYSFFANKYATNVFKVGQKLLLQWLTLLSLRELDMPVAYLTKHHLEKCWPVTLHTFGIVCYLVIDWRHDSPAAYSFKSPNSWPRNSPDLNPLEHLWSRLQQSVLRVPRPRNRDQLITRVQKEWDSITQLELSDLVRSFPRRLQACVDNSGSYTNYWLVAISSSFK